LYLGFQFIADVTSPILLGGAQFKPAVTPTILLELPSSNCVWHQLSCWEVPSSNWVWHQPPVGRCPVQTSQDTILLRGAQFKLSFTNHSVGRCPVQTNCDTNSPARRCQFKPPLTIILPGVAQFQSTLDTNQPAQFSLFSSDPSGKCNNNVSN
jgi:hypothetical protein